MPKIYTKLGYIADDQLETKIAIYQNYIPEVLFAENLYIDKSKQYKSQPHANLLIDLKEKTHSPDIKQIKRDELVFIDFAKNNVDITLNTSNKVKRCFLNAQTYRNTGDNSQYNQIRTLNRVEYLILAAGLIIPAHDNMYALSKDGILLTTPQTTQDDNFKISKNILNL